MKQKNRKKRGFTLIELLAVIAILAILMMLAASSVIPIIANSSKRAFLIDTQSVLDGARLAYTDAIANGTSSGTSVCISLSALKGRYLEKMDAYEHGSVLVSIDHGVASYSVWLSNDRYQFTNKLDTEITEASIEEIVNVTDQFDRCGGQGSLLSIVSE